MAIQKTKVLADGRTGDYWVTDIVTVGPDFGTVRAMLDLYENEASYVSGVAPIYSADVVLSAQDNPLNFRKVIELVEEKVVTLPGDFVSGVVL